MNRLHTAAAKSRSARFKLYTPCTRSYTHRHTKVISMKLYSLRPRSAAEWWNEILSTCFYVYAKLLYLSHIYPRCILFLIYQFQFLSPCHSRKAEDIFGCCHSSPPNLSPASSFYSVFQKKHSLVTPLLKTKDASGINNIESIFSSLKLPIGLFNLISSGHRSFWILLPWKDILPFPKASK